MALISCNQVTLGYENITVFKDLSFEVNKGDYLCIVGENGSGKSTLIKALLGLKKPLKGKVVTGEGLKQTQIGYLPQQTMIQKDFPASVYEVVLAGRLNHMGWHLFFNRDDKNAALEQMERLNIADLKDRSFQELSGGQQQRVLLARAMCATTALLLLDEPVAGLDPIATKDLYDTIRDLNRKEGITVIMVTHDVREVIRDANKILHLGASDYFFGTPDQYNSYRSGFAPEGQEQEVSTGNE